ncbi:nucleotidyltransferase family protein [Ensifer sp. NPDC090286]|uniref:nucleotidyltransferase family protein n=1 Tax=Ensifer sp. NPDC090286 TaxID=3363991 RepID=UPI00383A8136
MTRYNFDKALLGSNATLKELLHALDCAAEFRIILVVDAERRLVGTVTDGDVRRALLRGIGMDAPVSQILNDHPVTLPPTASHAQQKQRMLEAGVRQIVLVDEGRRVIGITTLDSLSTDYNHPNKVFLMAGGLGSRLMPLTEATPKPMLPVGGKPILQTIIENFINEGFSDFHLAVNYHADVIKDFFGDGEKFDCRITYVEEKKRMGTAGALSLISEKPKEPMIVMNGDLLTRVRFHNILDFHNNHDTLATMAVREYNFQVPFGVVKLEHTEIARIMEKPVQHFFVNAGIYVVSPEALSFIPQDTFYDMPSLFDDLQKAGFKNIAFPLQEYWIDIGRKEQLEQANDEYDRVFIN